MTHEERDVLWRWPRRGETVGLLRIARFDATQDVLLAASAMNRAPPAVPLKPSEFDAKAEALATACRRYLAAHETVKAAR